MLNTKLQIFVLQPGDLISGKITTSSMSCPHPSSAHHIDRSRGTVTCALCGEVVTDQQFELDPLFSRGDRPVVTTRSQLRALGAPRPMRTTVLQNPSSHRPSIEIARRGIAAIARQMEISADLVEMATAVYKLAVNVNAVSGARTCVLCACLYAVCRRENTTHMLYDFADGVKESPLVILHYMKLICRATSTAVPPLDSSLLLSRLAEQLGIGDAVLTQNVCVCALKILRMMEDSWINQGRRPLGLCAAALIIACEAFHVPIDSREICTYVRLTGHTLQQRLVEFWNTPASKLENLDEYDPTTVNIQLPTNFTCGLSSGAGNTDGYKEELLSLSQMYYELIAEAKVSTPATPERCEKWKRFVLAHSRINKIQVRDELLDLTQLSSQEQLARLGFPGAVVVPHETASQIQSDAAKMGFLRAAVVPSLKLSQRVKDAEGHSPTRSQSCSTQGRVTVQTQATERLELAAAKTAPRGEPVANSPFVPLSQQLDLMEAFLSNNVDQLDELDDFMRSPLLTAGPAPAAAFNAKISAGPDGLRDHDFEPNGGVADDENFLGEQPEEDEVPRELAERLERPHALQWEVVVLPPLAKDTVADIAEYVVFDLEQRLRAEKILEERLGKVAIARGRPSTPAQVLARLRSTYRNGKRRRLDDGRAAATQPSGTQQSALERALRGRGASSIDATGLDALIPGLAASNNDPSEVGSSVNDEWPVE
jgi:transcription factor IIIB subunit 2